MQKTTLKVNGMSCNHCVRAVTDAVSNLAGTSNVTVSLDPGEATFEFDEALTTLNAVRAAIAEEGYEVI